jgi:hypothetical protein
MNRSKLAKNAATDTNRTVGIERPAGNGVVAGKVASVESLNIDNYTQRIVGAGQWPPQPRLEK